MILVTGATGTAGSEVVRALAGQGVRILARDVGKAHRLFGDGVDVARGDFADGASVRAALEGVDALFLSCADDPRRVEWETSAIDAAVAAGVRRIVKLSSIEARPDAPVAFWDWHGRVEQHLQRATTAFVILRSNVYMSTVVGQLAGDGRLYAPAGNARIAMIDPRDVGATAAAVLTGAGEDGSTYVLTGPEAITYQRAAETLSTTYVDVTDDEARLGMIRQGVPEFVAGEIVKLFGQLRHGVAEPVAGTVEALTGRPPRDFASFAPVALSA